MVRPASMVVVEATDDLEHNAVAPVLQLQLLLVLQVRRDRLRLAHLVRRDRRGRRAQGPSLGLALLRRRIHPHRPHRLRDSLQTAHMELVLQLVHRGLVAEVLELHNPAPIELRGKMPGG